MRPLILVPVAIAAAPAYAQDAAPAAAPAAPAAADTQMDENGEEIVQHKGEILVVATRIKGQLDVPQAPIAVLDEADISAYGAGSIDELLEALSPQTGSGRGRGDGRPIVLVNGQRISSFREMRDIPPEAIRRMEIMPEEVALRFGYPPNQRVVNFILKDNFQSKTAAGEYHVPTRGGFADSELEAGVFRINKKTRMTISGRLNQTTMLTEAERSIVQPAENVPSVATDPDPAEFRSLLGRERQARLNGTYSAGLGEGASAPSLTLNGSFTRTDSRSLSGLDTVTLTSPGGQTALRSLDDPLVRRSRSNTFESGLAFLKPVGKWQLTATANGSYGDTDTEVDRRADTSALRAAAAAGILAISGPLPALTPAGQDRAETKNLGLSTLVTLNGNPVRLPGGDVSLTLKAGYDFTRTVNSDTRTPDDTRLRRGDVSGGFNLGIPITSRREKFGGGIGDISLNLSAGIDHLSDFGTLTDWNAGITWGITEKLGLQASWIVKEAAPSLADLGNPELLSFNVPVFDLSRGETVLVTVINGGNPNLVKEKQRDLKLGANWQLPWLRNSNLLFEYFRNRSSDVTQAFPLLTPAIEAAFPGRAVRDASGQLVSIDRRPVTFDETKSSRIRWGFNIGGTIGKPDPDAGGRGGMMGMLGGGPGGPGGGGPRMGGGPRPGGGGGPRGGGGGGFGRGPGPNNGQGRWNLALYHTYRISEQVRIAAAGPVLDLLNGEAISAGGVARHGVELEGGLFHKGFGLRLNGNWSAPTRLRASGAPGSSDLRFGSVTTLNARLFVNFDQQKKLVEGWKFLKGARLSLEADNLLDSRQKVTDPSGVVPLNYQAAYRDPRGRVIGLDFRKMF